MKRHTKRPHALMKLVPSWILCYSDPSRAAWCEPEYKLTLRWCTTQTVPTNPRHRHNIYTQPVIQIHSNIDQKILFCSFSVSSWSTSMGDQYKTRSDPDDNLELAWQKITQQGLAYLLNHALAKELVSGWMLYIFYINETRDRMRTIQPTEPVWPMQPKWC